MEAAVRKVLPKDEQIVAAMVGVYFSLYVVGKGVSKLTASPPPPPAPTPPVVATASAGTGAASKFGFEPPTFENFTEWGENAENWKAWEAFMSGPKFDLWADGKL